MDKPILNKIDSEKSRKTQARLSAMIESLGEIDEITDDTEDSLKEDHEYQTIDSSSSVSVLSDQFEPLRPTQLEVNSSIHTPPDQQLPSSFSSNSTENKRFSDNKFAINNNENIVENASDFVPQLQPQPQFQPLTSINSTPSISTSTHDPNTNDTSFNRCSMLSDYSGVIHEGTEVSYIVKNNTLNNNNDNKSNSNNTINTNNITSTITKTDNIATITAMTDNDNNDKFDSNHLSILSQPTASNEVIIKQIKNAKHVNRFNSLRYDTPSKLPRSHLKYRSDPLLVMQEQTEKQLNNLSLKESLPNIVHNQDRSDLDYSFSLKSNVNYLSSVPSGIRNNKSNELIELSLKDSERDGNTTPEESHNSSNNHSNDTSAIPRAPPRNKNRPKTILIDQDLSNPEIFPIPDSATLNKKNNDNANTSTNGNRNNMGGQQFNAHTISQLLSITNGTLIGSEFQDLPIPIDEKRALERLVDSLSRLTADMVLDPERYEQGLIRLKKAIRALEGFQ